MGLIQENLYSLTSGMLIHLVVTPEGTLQPNRSMHKEKKNEIEKSTKIFGADNG